MIRRLKAALKAPREAERLKEELASAKERLARQRTQLERLRVRPKPVELTESELFDPSRIIWLFGSQRTGSTWLASMMGDIEGHDMWNEPLVGALFGEFYYFRAAHKRGGKAILGHRYRSIWMRSIRSLVLEGATVRYPEVSTGGYLVIKEPHGSVGAPLLMEAVPESRMVFLARDPRDVVASSLDSQMKGSWARRIMEDKTGGEGRLATADIDPDAFVRAAATTYVWDVGNSAEAFEAHEGPKSFVKYEELRLNPLATLRRIYSELEIPVSERELVRVVEKHSWENVPEEKKGEGKFYRRAQPEGWREDLTPEQARIVEEVAAPLLLRFYPEG